MRFTLPLALLLMLILPVVAWVGWPPRGAERRRGSFSLVLRLIILVCLILSLAGLELVRSTDELAVVYLVDVSDSISPTARAAELAYVQASLQGMGPEDQAAVVVFGGDALVERPMSATRELGEFTSQPLPGQTDMAEAMRLGMALFPPGAARRMVILSDGLTTTGNTLATARMAAENGVQLVTVPVSSPPSNEALVTSVDAPEYLQQGERFDLEFGVHATGSSQATVRVLADGQAVYSGEIEIKPGEQSFSLPMSAGKTGFTRYQVQIQTPKDTWYQNNSLSSYSQVAGPQRVLLVVPRSGETMRDGTIRQDEAAQLEKALTAANFVVERVEPSGLPSDLVIMARYTSVILVDIPARDLSKGQMQTVQSFVRDLGGGLLVVGGPTSYGVGGYFKTPLEETLPVDMQIKDEKRRPSLAMVFIIDRSGSMTETSGGVTKLELAKEAAIRSVELLFPMDRVGVIAFDETATWVVPMTELSDVADVQRRIGTLRPGGGTDILAGLTAMANVLPDDPAKVKHVILLTDGGADISGIPELVTEMHDSYGITLTTVGVGNDAAAFLPDLAKRGGGNYHYALNPASIPSIFTEETTLATRSYIEEHPFFPAQANPSQILAGIREVPQLEGYVGTTIKDTAQAILISDLKDPILAAWQYGLGRAVAFTSDATGRWAQQWLNWNSFADFWAQTVRYTMRDRAPSTMDVRVENQGENAQIIVDAQREAGDYLNGYQMQAVIVAPDGTRQEVPLQQIAPGQYTAPFTPDAQGAYMITLQGKPPAGVEQNEIVETTGWSMAYSPEYRALGSEQHTLENVAALSNGKPLDLATSAGQIFAHTLPAARDTSPIWPWLLALATVLLPLDIAVRRLLLEPAAMVRAVRQRIGRLLRREVQPAVPAPRSARMSGLFEAKQRAGEGQPAPASNEAPARTQPVPLTEAAKEAKAEPVVAQEVPEEPARPAAGASTVSNLLAGKRDRKK